jgi:hypothetical protein
MGGGMLRLPVKLITICAGLFGIIIGAHGLYIHFSKASIFLPRIEAEYSDIAFADLERVEKVLGFDRLFATIDVPSWFKGIITWTTWRGLESWVIPAVITVAGLVVCWAGIGIQTRLPRLPRYLERIKRKLW